jgi:hypothetical protein
MIVFFVWIFLCVETIEEAEVGRKKALSSAPKSVTKRKADGQDQAPTLLGPTFSKEVKKLKLGLQKPLKMVKSASATKKFALPASTSKAPPFPADYEPPPLVFSSSSAGEKSPVPFKSLSKGNESQILTTTKHEFI